MKQYKDNDGKIVGELTCIARYFRKADETMSDFQAQCKILTPEAKQELAVGAAKELGYTEVVS